MAYVSRGFTPVSGVISQNPRSEKYYVPASDSTALAIGDIVKRVAGGDADGVPTCTRITGIDDVPVGVIMGFVPDPAYLEQNHRTASTLRYALVNTDPYIELIAQEDNASSATLAATRLGAPIDVAIAAVDTPSGTSSMQLSSATLAGSPGMFRLQRRLDGVDNPAIGGSHTNWVVTFNVHQKKATA